jgi:two-component system, chemotaxis family, protein-glutamate methylesterase/glutaminase
MIDVLLIRDPDSAANLSSILTADPSIDLIGTAYNAKSTFEFLNKHIPNVIVMDPFVSGGSGMEITRRIMTTRPVPVILLRDRLHEEDQQLIDQCLKAGAVIAIQTPENERDAVRCAQLVATVKTMSESRLVTRRTSTTKRSQSLEEKAMRHRQPVVKLPTERPIEAIARRPIEATAKQPIEVTARRPIEVTAKQPIEVTAKGPIEVIAIGASIGGPPVLSTILSELPHDFPVPILLVQHISEGFLLQLVQQLNGSTKLVVKIGEPQEQIKLGTVYLPPENHHMGVTGRGRIFLSEDEPEYSMRPAVSFLFRSVAESFGRRSIGVLLTGMGKDGSLELGLMRKTGAITIAQDEETSTVHGMAGEAVRQGCASLVLPAQAIAARLHSLVMGDVRNSSPVRKTSGNK